MLVLLAALILGVLPAGAAVLSPLPRQRRPQEEAAARRLLSFPAPAATVLLSTQTGGTSACVQVDTLSVFSPNGLWLVVFPSSGLFGGDVKLYNCAQANVNCVATGVLYYDMLAGQYATSLCLQQNGDLSAINQAFWGSYTPWDASGGGVSNSRRRALQVRRTR